MATKIEELVDRVAGRAGLERASEMKEAEDQLRKAMTVGRLSESGLREWERMAEDFGSSRQHSEMHEKLMEEKRQAMIEEANRHLPEPFFANALFREGPVFTRGQRGIQIPVKIPPKPSKSAIAVINDPDCDAECAALARELGVYNAPLVNMELETFLAENFIEVYPLASVKAYMDALCADAQQKASFGEYVRWAWYPLRKVDVLNGSGDGWDGTVQYAKRVPLPAMQTVKRIVQGFVDAAVHFFVTDVKQVKDPFLGVTVASEAEGIFKMHVIERWDEPKYRS